MVMGKPARPSWTLIDQMTSGLTLKTIRIALGGQELLAIDAHVNAGDILTVMGPSGSGKSSLFAFLAGFLDPVFEASGSVVVNGEDVSRKPAHQRHLGLLFQDPLLFPHMDVTGNLLFALPQSIKGKAQRLDRVDAALTEIGLNGFGQRDPDTLSGGQKARVALLRTLLCEPKALLLDEPFSKLDAGLRTQMRTLVFGTAKRLQLPVVLVTHDEVDAEAAGGAVIRLGT
jgi:putative thiamine transport system ATP-binding protein